MDFLGKAFASFLLICFGMSLVIVAERMRVVDPMCLVSNDIMDSGGWRPGHK